MGSQVEKTKDALPDLLCLHSVDNGVEHRRNKQVGVGHDDGQEGVMPLVKAMHHRQSNERHVEYENCAHMGDTRAKCLCLGFTCQAQHSLEDKQVRQRDEKRVHANGRDDDDEAIDDVDADVSTGQLHDILVEAVGMGKDVGAAERQPFDENRQRCHKGNTPHHGSHANLGNTGQC